MLKALADRGFKQVLGSDPSADCVRAAGELYGVPAIMGNVFTVAAGLPLYDFLILTGVLEHIRDLPEAVEKLLALLREGGRVYVEVPDASRYDSGLDAPFQEFSVEHINFFSRIP